MVVVGTAVEFGTSMRNVPASGGLRAAMGPGQLMTTGAVAGVALARALGLRPIMQARCMSLCILLLWLRVFDVAALSCRYVGPFFLMVLDMVRQVRTPSPCPCLPRSTVGTLLRIRSSAVAPKRSWCWKGTPKVASAIPNYGR